MCSVDYFKEKLSNLKKKIYIYYTFNSLDPTLKFIVIITIRGARNLRGNLKPVSVSVF